MAEAAPAPEQWPVLPKDIEIATRCAALNKPATQAEDEVDKFLVQRTSDRKEVIYVVEDDEGAAKAADFITFCNRALTKIEERRLEYTLPSRTFQTDLNNEVKRYTTRIEAVKARAKAALLKFEQEKRAAEAQRLREANEKREREAVEAAEKLQSEGNQAGAQRVIEVASSAPRRSAVKPVETRGEVTGRRVAMRTTWTGSVDNLNVLLQAVIDGKISAEGITIGQGWMNKLAAAHQKEEVFHGVKITKTESV